MQFSSDDLPAPERFDVWRDTLTRKLLHFAIDLVPGHAFKARASLRSHHEVRVGFGEISPSVHRRTRQMVACDNGDLTFLVNLQGASAFCQADREIELGEGDATVLDCAEAATFVHHQAGKLLCFRFSPETLLPFLFAPRDGVARLIDRRSPSLRLLVSYLSMLEHDEIEMAERPDISRAVVHHLSDLLALTLGAHRDAVAFAAGRGVRAARFRSVKLYIAGRIGPHPLDVEEVARHEGVSPRYVRKLFESEGGSFTAHVRDARLKRAHDMLINPRFAAMSITSIAYDVGFNDLSNFNRAFRRLFELTPREARVKALDDWRGAQ